MVSAYIPSNDRNCDSERTKLIRHVWKVLRRSFLYTNRLESVEFDNFSAWTVVDHLVSLCNYLRGVRYWYDRDVLMNRYLNCNCREYMICYDDNSNDWYEMDAVFRY